MKKKLVVVLMAAVMAMTAVTGCGSKADDAKNGTQASKASESETSANADQEAAMHVADLIDAIYVQERTDDTDKQCKEAKEAWDKLTDAQKELVEGENADPDYFGRDTGDASKDDPRNQDDIGENEILVVSFGTSFNDSRVADIKGVEDAIAAANPDWSVRRAFTAQIIINHVQARDDEKIDNMDQALERAVKNGVKNLVVQPTHLMHGAEYDELSEAVEKYKDKFESVKIAEPLLGEVGSDATVVNEDKKAVAEILTEEAVEKAGYGASLQQVKGKSAAQAVSPVDTAKKEYEALKEVIYDNEALQKNYASLTGLLMKKAEVLNRYRMISSKKILTGVVTTLKDMGMENARMELHLVAQKSPMPNGAEEMEFYFSANPGEPLRSMRDTASGGEISRIALAIEMVISHLLSQQTLIFDEIDVGISGKVGLKVARKIACLAKTIQVLCITHLPQTACAADRHYQIVKTIANGRTSTKAVLLNDAQHLDNIAQMISGTEDSKSALTSAKEMRRLVIGR